MTAPLLATPAEITSAASEAGFPPDFFANLHGDDARFIEEHPAQARTHGTPSHKGGGYRFFRTAHPCG